LKPIDLLWIFAYPLYQVMGTFRHEASHAVFALLEGVRVTEFVILPAVLPNRGFVLGYVRWEGDPSWLALAAPYFVDLVTYLLFFVICMRVNFKPRWVWINAIVIGMISPLVNSAYNYQGITGTTNDIGKLTESLPEIGIHLYFILTFLVYVIGLVLVFKYSKVSRRS
jgi:hypothetical protein